MDYRYLFNFYFSKYEWTPDYVSNINKDFEPSQQSIESIFINAGEQNIDVIVLPILHPKSYFK